MNLFLLSLQSIIPPSTVIFYRINSGNQHCISADCIFKLIICPNVMSNNKTWLITTTDNNNYQPGWQFNRSSYKVTTFSTVCFYWKTKQHSCSGQKPTWLCKQNYAFVWKDRHIVNTFLKKAFSIGYNVKLYLQTTLKLQSLQSHK